MRKTSVTDRRRDGQTDGLTECKPIVPPGFTGWGLKKVSAVAVIRKYFQTFIYILAKLSVCVLCI